MKELLRYLFLESAITRQVIYAFTGQVMIFYQADRMLVRRHSRIPLIICLIIKTLMYYPIELYLHLHPVLYTQAPTWLILYNFWRDTIISGLFLWTYARNSGKAGLTLVIGETEAALLTFPALGLLNFLEGRPSLTTLAYPFMWADLLIPVLFWLEWRLIRRPVLSMAEKYRVWRPKYPIILWAVYILYWLSASFTGISLEVMHSVHGDLIRHHQIFGAAGMAVLMIWLIHQERQAALQHEYLVKQSAFARAYDQIFERNRAAAEKVQEQISRQTEELSLQAEAGKTPEAEQMKSYLEQLQKEAALLQTGSVYCGNHLVDAVLCMEQQMLEKLGYQADFRCVNVPERMEDTSALPQILELVCEEWMEQHGSGRADCEGHAGGRTVICRLQITAARGQLVITVNADGKWKRSRRRLLEGILAPAGGELLTGKKAGTEGSIVILPLDREDTDIQGDVMHAGNNQVHPL